MIRRFIETFKLSSSDISLKRVTLSHTPMTIAIDCQIGHAGYSVIDQDWHLLSSSVISWNGYPWQDILLEGDILVANYQYDDGSATPSNAHDSLTSFEKCEIFTLTSGQIELKLTRTPKRDDVGSLVLLKLTNGPTLIPKTSNLSIGDYDYHYVNDANGPRVVLLDSEVSLRDQLRVGDVLTVFYEYDLPSESNQRRCQQFVLVNSDIVNKQIKLPMPANISTNTSFDFQVNGCGSLVRNYDYKVFQDSVFWSGTALDGLLRSGDIVTLYYHVDVV